MIITPTKLCTRALKLFGVVGQGETIDADDLADAFETLQELMDGLRTDSLAVYVTERYVAPLSSGVQDYYIGEASGADYDRQKPLWLSRASIMIPQSGPPEVEQPIRVITLGQWQNIAIKSQTAPFPWQLWYDNDAPLGGLHFWPIPTQAVDAILYLPKSLGQWASLSEEVDMPPGYARALRYLLAVDLIPEFGRAVDPTVIQTIMRKAEEYKRDIETVNAATQVNIVPVDLGLQMRRPDGFWNQYLGDYEGRG
jgi:hypothetical protein